MAAKFKKKIYLTTINQGSNMKSDFLEKDLEDLIFKNKDRIHEYGFIQFSTNSFRQYVLPSGKKLTKKFT